jgi:hypothetical protein
VRGDWHGPEEDARRVIARVRQAALAGIALRSPRQPKGLIVENKRDGSPSVWLHNEQADWAWIMLDMTAAGAWCQLAYQLTHELGHCLANSWQSDAMPHPPSQWLEEALAEAFALRALGRLADDWQAEPVFAGRAAYANAIWDYREDIVGQYRNEGREAGATDLRSWFQTKADAFRRVTGLHGIAEDVVPAILRVIEPDPLLIEDYQAMNLWSERTALPVSDYLRRWQQECQAIGSAGRLPLLIVDMLGVAGPVPQ